MLLCCGIQKALTDTGEVMDRKRKSIAFIIWEGWQLTHTTHSSISTRTEYPGPDCSILRAESWMLQIILSILCMYRFITIKASLKIRVHSKRVESISEATIQAKYTKTCGFIISSSNGEKFWTSWNVGVTSPDCVTRTRYRECMCMCVCTINYSNIAQSNIKVSQTHSRSTSNFFPQQTCRTLCSFYPQSYWQMWARKSCSESDCGQSHGLHYTLFLLKFWRTQNTIALVLDKHHYAQRSTTWIRFKLEQRFVPQPHWANKTLELVQKGTFIEVQRIRIHRINLWHRQSTGESSIWQMEW